jgi:glycine dehydrogenase subunit 2
VVRAGEGYALQHEDARSIGRVHSFYGNFLVCLKALVYIMMLGGEGIREAAETAVLNANYLKAVLSKIYNLPIDRICKHEFVLNDEGLPGGVTTNDIAKRILDYGFHAPTIYFPLLVPGAMMIEPTETESRVSLEKFIEAMRCIREEIDTDPGMVKAAPHTTPVGRVDAVAAARKPVLTATIWRNRISAVALCCCRGRLCVRRDDRLFRQSVQPEPGFCFCPLQIRKRRFKLFFRYNQAGKIQFL